MKDSRLLPCPFCGGEAEIVRDYEYFHTVFCPECMVQITKYDEKEAIKIWNRRSLQDDILHECAQMMAGTGWKKI